jgi:hypothetical protein
MASRVASHLSLPLSRLGMGKENTRVSLHPVHKSRMEALSPRTLAAIEFNKKSVAYSQEQGVHLKDIKTWRLIDPRLSLKAVFGPRTKELGSGEFGRVVLRENDVGQFAEKTLDPKKTSDGKAITELKAGVMASEGKRFRSRYLLKRYDGFTLVTDYVPGKSHAQVELENCASKPTQERGLQMIATLCRFLKKKLAPADLHSGNVMVKEDTVIDYGEFTLIKEGKMNEKQFRKAVIAIRDGLQLTAPSSREMTKILQEPMRPRVVRSIKPDKRVAYLLDLLKRCEKVLRA